MTSPPALVRAVAIVTAAALVVAACGPQRPSADTGRSGGPSSAQPSRPHDPGPVEPTSFTVVGTGDVLIHPALTDQAKADAGGAGRDFRPLLAGVEPVVAGADLALCHLEVPLAPEGGPFSGYPSFNAPPEVAGALVDTGYDGCSTASNHVLDRGADGVYRTLDAMDRAGLRHTGSARDEQEAAEPLLYDVSGIKVGHVSFSYGFNGIEIPQGKPWLTNQLDAEKVVSAADAAREAGAEVVIASLHWGEEYRHDPTEEQTALAKQLMAEDSIDLILGHHAHVVQPIEKVDGKWVAYGLGNHIARHEEPRGVSEEGIAARFTFTHGTDGWRVSKAEYVPTLVDLGPPIRLLDLTSPGAAGHDKSLQRTDRIVLSRDGAEDGLTRPGR